MAKSWKVSDETYPNVRVYGECHYVNDGNGDTVAVVPAQRGPADDCGDPTFLPTRARLISAAPDLLAAVEALFPPDDRARYEGAPLADLIEAKLTCTRAEVLALFAAIDKATGKE